MNDPAVDTWAEAFREVTGRDLRPRTVARPTPFQQVHDDLLEAIAEERAAYRRGDYMTGEDCDAAADRYYENGGPQL